MNCALIMAGGAGTRFWPKSTTEKPKQFISLTNDATMLQLTIERIKETFEIDKIFVSTSEKHKDLVIEQLPDLPEDNIIIEPLSKNTAPCILLSCFYIKKKFDTCNIAIFPSDHIIKDKNLLNQMIKKSLAFIENKKKGIVTIGVVPNRPETGYGYIKIKEEKYQQNEIMCAEKFVEKPDVNTAIQYIKEKKYFWNAGMFIFNVDYLINNFKEKLPSVYQSIQEINKSDNYYVSLRKNYNLVEKISFDYGIMERNNEVYVLPTNFGWDDIGTWSSLERYLPKDDNQNIIKGKVELLNSRNCIVYTNTKKIMLIDMENIYCIDSDDILIIGPKEKINDVPKQRKSDTEGIKK